MKTRIKNGVILLWREGAPNTLGLSCEEKCSDPLPFQLSFSCIFSHPNEVSIEIRWLFHCWLSVHFFISPNVIAFKCQSWKKLSIIFKGFDEAMFDEKTHGVCVQTGPKVAGCTGRMPEWCASGVRPAQRGRSHGQRSAAGPNTIWTSP